MIITMGLTQVPEFRGKTEQSWQQSSLLPNRDIAAFKNLLKYLNVCNNMSYYRSAFKKSAKAPCIPFFPIVLKDLTFLTDGNATIKPDGLVNFTKFRMLVQSIHTVLNHTVENYSFTAEMESFLFFSPQHHETHEVNGTSALDQIASVLEVHINRRQEAQAETTISSSLSQVPPFVEDKSGLR